MPVQKIRCQEFSFHVFLTVKFHVQIPGYRELCRSIGPFQSWNGALHPDSALVTLGRIRRNPLKPGVTSTSGFFHSRRDVFPEHGSVAEKQGLTPTEEGGETQPAVVDETD
jgi:hypothetical protein